MNPKISVIVPNYNHENFLKERIESILNQSFQDFELIILDDCSTDQSLKIIEEYSEHPKVKVIIKNDKNSGSTFFQWNKAVFNYAKGDLVWIAESDDVAEYRFLEELVPIFEKDSKIVLAYCQSAKLNSKSIITGSWEEWTKKLVNGNFFNKSFRMNGQEYIHNFLIHKNTIPNASAVIFRREIYIEVGGAVVEMRTNGDWDLWLKFLLLGDVYFSNQLLNKFRYHENSVIAKATKNDSNKFLRKNRILKQSIELRDSFDNQFLKVGLTNKKISKINRNYKSLDIIFLLFTTVCLFFIRNKVG